MPPEQLACEPSGNSVQHPPKLAKRGLRFKEPVALVHRTAGQQAPCCPKPLHEMMPEQEPSRAGTPRGCLPFVVAGLVVLAVLAIGTIFLARQITIGPFDEEPREEIYFITEYHAFIAKEDRVDNRGEPLTDVLAILRRDRENYHLHMIRQQGDTEDLRLDAGAFATEEKRAELSRAELSIPDMLKARMLTGDMRVRVLLHSRARDPRLLVAVSELPTDNDP